MGPFDITPDLLDDSIVIYPRVGVSGSGQPLFGPGVVYPAYVESGSRVVVDSKGHKVTCNLFCMFGGECGLAVADDAEWHGRRYEAIAVEPFSMNGNVVHIEASFRSVSR